MKKTSLKNRLIENINTLSEEQLNSVLSFVERLKNSLKEANEIQRPKTIEERRALAERFKQLCQKTQAQFADNPITEEEIQREIDAYRRGE